MHSDTHGNRRWNLDHLHRWPAAPGWIGAAVLLLALLLAGAPGAAAPQDGEGAGGQEGAVQRGHDLYAIHCANCHGSAGRGDGPMADVLKVPPPDLTLLSSRAGGTFPRHEVHRTIDGRREIRSHGGRQMPVWGLAFQERGRVAEQEQDVQARIADLVAYLESIQREE